MCKPAFHVHVDAQTITPECREFIINKLGFWPQEFLHDHPGVSYEPACHLTHKPRDAKDYRTVFDSVREYLQANPGLMTGYVEGECIPQDIDIENRPFNPAVPKPFRVTHTSLQPDWFRESEIHVALSRDQSDARLLEALADMNLFVGYLPKKEGVAAIYTVQGTRQQIGALFPALAHYLQRAGGGVRCSIKEERIADWWTTSSDIALPPVVGEIEWL